MPYPKLSDLPKSITNNLPYAAQVIYQEVFNQVYHSSCESQNDKDACASRIAWAAVKYRFNQNDKGKWIATSAISSSILPFNLAGGADNPLKITGPLVEINQKNLNGWGVPGVESEAVMAGLIGVPLRKCSGQEAILNGHSCDYNWDPKDDIGKIVDTFELDNWIWATADVNDPVADSKLQNNVWNKSWSIFLTYEQEDANNLFHGINPKSVTLVDKPAYENAKFNFKAAALESLHNGAGVRKLTDKDKEEYTKEKVDELIKATKAEIKSEHDKSIEDMKTGHDTELDKLKADHAKEIEDLKKDDDGAGDDPGKDKDKNPDDPGKSGNPDMVPREEVEKMIESSVQQATEQTMEHIAVETLSDEVTDMQISAGMIKDDPKEKVDLKAKLIKKSSAALREEKDLLLKVREALKASGEEAVNKFKEANLPAKPEGASAEAMLESIDKINNKFLGAN